MYRLRITADLGFEVWQDIPGYEGLYQVSTYGRVKSLDHYVSNNHRNGLSLKKGRILEPQKYKGYRSICFSKDSVVRRFQIHRIVANVFIPNFNGYPIINHIDVNPSNNRVENLEWCTYSYNNNYDNAVSKRAVQLMKKIAMYDKNGNLLYEYDNSKEAGKDLGVSVGAIQKACTNRNKSCKGYVFKYL